MLSLRYNKSKILSSWQLKILTGLICISAGIGSEYLQNWFNPNRIFDWGDVWCNLIGILIAICLGLIIEYKIENQSQHIYAQIQNDIELRNSLV